MDQQAVGWWTECMFEFMCRCRRWVINCRRADLDTKKTKEIQTGGHVLCEEHFENPQFMNRESHNKLVWDAVPTMWVLHPKSFSVYTNRSLCFHSTAQHNNFSVCFNYHPKISQNICLHWQAWLDCCGHAWAPDLTSCLLEQLVSAFWFWSLELEFWFYKCIFNLILMLHACFIHLQSQVTLWRGGKWLAPDCSIHAPPYTYNTQPHKLESSECELLPGWSTHPSTAQCCHSN